MNSFRNQWLTVLSLKEKKIIISISLRLSTHPALINMSVQPPDLKFLSVVSLSQLSDKQEDGSMGKRLTIWSCSIEVNFSRKKQLDYVYLI